MQKEDGDARRWTYRGGRRIELRKRPDELIVRAGVKQLPDLFWHRWERASSGSIRVTVHADALEDWMKQCRAHKLVTHHAYERVGTEASFVPSDRVFVHFHPHISERKQAQFRLRYCLELVRPIGPYVLLLRVTDYTAMNPTKLVQRLTERETDWVELAENDLNYWFSNTQIDEPGLTSSTPSLTQGGDAWHLEKIGARGAWKMLECRRRNRVVVGVIDDGFDFNHPDFQSHGKIEGWGFITKAGNLQTNEGPDPVPELNRSVMWQEGDDHGVQCAGLIGADAGRDGRPTVGVAPDCGLLPIRFHLPRDKGSLKSASAADSKMMSVLDHLGTRVDIISLSQVPRTDQDGRRGHDRSIQWGCAVVQKIEALTRSGGPGGKGVLFVWAAGNDNIPIDYCSRDPLPVIDEDTVNPWEHLGVDREFNFNVAHLDGVLRVGAMTSDERKAHYSNWGPGIDLCAPSGNYYTYRDVPLAGKGLTTTASQANNGEKLLIRNDAKGTSFATPIVAGVAALVKQANPELSALEIAEILRWTAKRVGAADKDPVTPAPQDQCKGFWDISPNPPYDSGTFRPIDSPDGDWSPWYGYGRVDAAAAVKMALDRRKPWLLRKADALADLVKRRVLVSGTREDQPRGLGSSIIPPRFS